MDSTALYDQVNKRYGSVNKTNTGQYEQTVAKSFGYTEDELAGIPEGANLGLSCGNPFAVANLKQGETVVDLGCGAGFDIFMASKKVGATGKAIGVDMNKTMLDKANANKAKTNAENVEFVEGVLISIPLQDNIADCIISNCVINLVPESDKQLAFNEMYRLLKPGGRVAISDTLARKELTKEMKANMALYVGCISGASQVREYEAYLENAGFKDVLIVDTKNDLNVYVNAADEAPACCIPPKEKKSACCSAEIKATCCDSDQKGVCCKSGSSACGCQESKEMKMGTEKFDAAMKALDMNEWAGSFHVYALKPLSVL